MNIFKTASIPEGSLLFSTQLPPPPPPRLDITLFELKNDRNFCVSVSRVKKKVKCSKITYVLISRDYKSQIVRTIVNSMANSLEHNGFGGKPGDEVRGKEPDRGYRAYPLLSPYSFSL